MQNQLIQHTHDGTSLNYQALLMTDKSRGQTIILLTNNKQNKLYDLAAAIKVILEQAPE